MITIVPTRQEGDLITPTDVNTLSDNDVDLNSRVETIEASYFTLITLQSDAVNSEAVANTLKDTGLEFSVEANKKYAFYICCEYDAAATTTGSRWVLDGATLSTLAAVQCVSLTTTTQTINYINAYNLPAACNASSAYTTGNIMTTEGIIKCSADGVVKLRFASEVANSAITAKAGSYILVRKLL